MINSLNCRGFVKALGFAFLLSTIIPLQASAYSVTENTLHINQSRLKAKCKSSGGTSTKGEAGKGSYGCNVKRDDGGVTTVNCNKKGNCIGLTESR